MTFPQIGWITIFFLLYLGFFPNQLLAKNDPEAEFDEILIYVNLPNYGGIDIPAAVRNEKVYLSVRDLFDFLQIKNNLSADNTIQGFILNQNDSFIINDQNLSVSYQQQVFTLPPADFIRQDEFLYLRSDLYEEIFRLNCTFNFRNLSVTLTTKLDLPVFRLMRQEMIRKNLNRLHGMTEPDSVIKRKKSVLKLQMADWAVMDSRLLTFQAKEHFSSMILDMTRFNLALGGEFAYGEINANFNAIAGSPIRHRDQFYQWRYVNNDNNLVRQISAGRINLQSTATILAPLVGMQVTNASTLQRKSFGSYRITDHTEPEWLVELYVNQILIDFIRADAAGLYSFDVPLIYGNTNVQLRFYGPHGEEYSREEFINIPFNFLPKKELEYTLSSGLVDDGIGSMFSRGSLNYGLSNRITLGGGVEFLSSLSHRQFMPFVQTSVKISDGMLFSGDYMPGVRLRGLLNYRLPSNMNLDLSYTRLDKDQQAIFLNYLEERNISLTLPIKKNNFSLFSRLSVNQAVFPSGTFTNAQLLLSGSAFGIPTNLTTIGVIGSHQVNIYSMISQTYRLPFEISLNPRIEYNYTARKISNGMLRMEKRVFRRGYFNLFYQNNFMFRNHSLGMGFRYDLSFANVGLQARNSQGQVLMTQTARGSMMYDGNTGHVNFNDKVNVGKGAITVLPFLDLNGNGKRDKNELRVSGLKLRIKGGQIQYDKSGEAIRITNLIAYEDYLIELDRSSFDNVAWRIKNAVLKVRVDPNQFKKVEVPITVMGEAAGIVYLENAPHGIGRIKMNIFNTQDMLIASVLTEQDGYFSYMELPPGDYLILPDAEQLRELGYSFQTGSTRFSIQEEREGDFVDGLDFILTEHKGAGEKF